MALHALRTAGSYRLEGLLTTVTRDYDRVSMHGVRRDLLRQQAASIGLPLHEVFVPAACSNAAYEAAMDEALAVHRERGIDTIGFGDLFLADIRAYRDKLVERSGMRAIYPVWGRDTDEFVREFLAQGFKAVITCIDLSVLDASFSGRTIDADLLRDLPEGVDPCGENGEFHTFVYDGPPFRAPVAFAIGESVVRGSFCFCDLEPEGIGTSGVPRMVIQPC